MRLISVALVVLLISGCTSVPTQNYSHLQDPDNSDPAMAVFLAWYQSLVVFDEDTFSKLTYWEPTMQEMVWQMGMRHRITMPYAIKITEPRRNLNDSVSFTALGCRNGQWLANKIVMTTTKGIWQVVSGDWKRPTMIPNSECPQ